MQREMPCRRAALLAGMGVLMLALAGPARGAFVVFSAGGDANPASIQPTVDAFRAALGNPNNGNAAGPLVGGRREINWDGGGLAVATPSASPLTSFQNTRGATFTTPGTGFLQTPLNAPELTGINPAYQTTFSVFSPLRIFTPVGSNVTDVTFSVPASNGATAATVSGFGVVLSDVDLADATLVQFFDPAQNLIESVFAPAGTVAAGSLSFIGALADAGEDISRVRIISGNAALGPDDSALADVVVMDDVIYSEPVPEPGSAAIVLAGTLVTAMRRRRRGCMGTAYRA